MRMGAYKGRRRKSNKRLRERKEEAWVRNWF